MQGYCAGSLGFVYLPPPGGSRWDVGFTTFKLSYHSTVKPVYPPGDPLADQPSPPPCSYSVAPPTLLQARVGGAPLLASWSESGQRFGFATSIEPEVGTDLVRVISDKHESSCDAYHSSFAPPSGVDLKSAVVNGIRFSGSSGSGQATALLTMSRKHLKRLEFPINRLAAGKGFALDSGARHKTTKVGATETDKSTWQTKVRFTRLSG